MLNKSKTTSMLNLNTFLRPFLLSQNTQKNNKSLRNNKRNNKNQRKYHVEVRKMHRKGPEHRLNQYSDKEGNAKKLKEKLINLKKIKKRKNKSPKSAFQSQHQPQSVQQHGLASKTKTSQSWAPLPLSSWASSSKNNDVNLSLFILIFSSINFIQSFFSLL